MSSIHKDVLAFYKELPFNYGDSIEADVERVENTNIEASYPVLPALLKARPCVLEIGCGAGWLACALARHWKCRVTAVDFNAVAVERARAIAAAMDLDVRWVVADLFSYEPEKPADLIVSLGVLHHTPDCLGAIERCLTRFTRPGGHFLLGLYHAFGRRAFREHFDNLRTAGRTENELFEEYRRLHHWLADETHFRSWFRDQVLHPHETHHTLKEIEAVARRCGSSIVSTSINRFAPFDSLESLFSQETAYEKIGQEKLQAGQYFPGFFVTLFKRDADCC